MLSYVFRENVAFFLLTGKGGVDHFVVLKMANKAWVSYL